MEGGNTFDSDNVERYSSHRTMKVSRFESKYALEPNGMIRHPRYSWWRSIGYVDRRSLSNGAELASDTFQLRIGDVVEVPQLLQSLVAGGPEPAPVGF